VSKVFCKNSTIIVCYRQRDRQTRGHTDRRMDRRHVSKQ